MISSFYPGTFQSQPIINRIVTGRMNKATADSKAVALSVCDNATIDMYIVRYI